MGDAQVAPSAASLGVRGDRGGVRVPAGSMRCRVAAVDEVEAVLELAVAFYQEDTFRVDPRANAPTSVS